MIFFWCLSLATFILCLGAISVVVGLSKVREKESCHLHSESRNKMIQFQWCEEKLPTSHNRFLNFVHDRIRSYSKPPVIQLNDQSRILSYKQEMYCCTTIAPPGNLFRYSKRKYKQSIFLCIYHHKIPLHYLFLISLCKNFFWGIENCHEIQVETQKGGTRNS